MKLATEDASRMGYSRNDAHFSAMDGDTLAASNEFCRELKTRACGLCAGVANSLH